MFIAVFLCTGACNKEVVKENGEMTERSPVKEGNVVKLGEAEKLFKGYYIARYTIKDPANPPTFDEIAGNIKRYLSEDEYNAQILNRFYSMPSLVAKEINKSIEVQSVKLEEQSINEDGTVDYIYTTVFKIYDENSSKLYEKEGEITITIIDNELKVTRDWSRGIKIDGLDGGL
ncbi:hypothetical protein BS1321_15855 [Peribacillus simplex NBRC 15720 = DSM 1321]|uniref:Uncharacterized protein n=1 Tax=Peribacillus simplex NBRC 15720 = DSM 1321 TaxID=1349754 RepID=A0A223EJ22_9BACI|nr:hypothetical protein BS1321_15855 [Peribacillus simplex NBRC 15720 = DSM 1321]